MMMWDEVMSSFVLPRLEMDSALIAALGNKTRIYMADSSLPVQVPSVQWLILDDRFSEVFNPIDVQFDYWANNADQATTIERRIRLNCHKEVRQKTADFDIALTYQDSFTHDFPKPGVIHRSLRFRFEPVRHRWAAGIVS